jgi:hypothetical protein
MREQLHTLSAGRYIMKKLIIVSLVIIVLMAGLWVLAGSGIAHATGASAAHQLMPLSAPAPTATPRPPAKLPPTGGDTADWSGAALLIGLGALLIVSGLILSYHFRTRS